MTAKHEILRRISAATRDVPAHEQPNAPIARDYVRVTSATHEELIEQLIDRLVDYKAAVRRVPTAELPAAIQQSLAARNVQRLVLPADFPNEWVPNGLTQLRDTGLSHAELDTSDGVVTGCVLAVAQTGTIVLDGGMYQGRRALSLVPDYHLCIVRADQVVGNVPEAISALHTTAVAERRALTFISGPSATSDIELNRVEGVHGPRTLEVLIVEA